MDSIDKQLAARAAEKNKLIAEETELDESLHVAKLNAKRAKLTRLNALARAAETEVLALDDRAEDGSVAATALRAAQSIQDREEGKPTENRNIDIKSGGKPLTLLSALDEVAE